MKTIYNLLWAILLVLGITACGGGGGGGGNTQASQGDTTSSAQHEDDTTTPTHTDDDSDTPPSKGREMQKGKSYTLHRGDVIIRQSSRTILVLNTDIQTGETNATLESGSARIE
jgi:hypothetical protein